MFSSSSTSFVIVVVAIIETITINDIIINLHILISVHVRCKVFITSRVQTKYNKRRQRRALKLTRICGEEKREVEKQNNKTTMTTTRLNRNAALLGDAEYRQTRAPLVFQVLWCSSIIILMHSTLLFLIACINIILRKNLEYFSAMLRRIAPSFYFYPYIDEILM